MTLKMRELLPLTTPTKVSIAPRRGCGDVLSDWKYDLSAYLGMRDGLRHLCGMPGTAGYCRKVFAVDCCYDTPVKNGEEFIRDVTLEFENVLGAATARKLTKRLSYMGRIVPFGGGSRVHATLIFAQPLPEGVESASSLIPLKNAWKVQFTYPDCKESDDDDGKSFMDKQRELRDKMAEAGVGLNFSQLPWEAWCEG